MHIDQMMSQSVPFASSKSSQEYNILVSWAIGNLNRELWSWWILLVFDTFSQLKGTAFAANFEIYFSTGLQVIEVSIALPLWNECSLNLSPIDIGIISWHAFCFLIQSRILRILVVSSLHPFISSLFDMLFILSRTIYRGRRDFNCVIDLRQ